MPQKKQDNNLLLESAAFSDWRFKTTDNRVSHYFVTDHLGSVRTVVNGSGEVLERSDYQPFGLRWNDNAQIVSDNRYRYNGKEDQSFVSLPYSDYGARMYDPNVGRWIETDPLAEKYYPISPYAFCANNPLKYVDRDGRKIYFAAGVSQQFKDKFATTIKYMNTRGSAGDIAALEASDDIYYINEKTPDNRSNLFDSKNQIIYWDPNTAFQTDEGIWVSPATVLAHEAGHAKTYNANPSEYKQNRSTKDAEYGNKEERRNITKTEQDAARKHKEVKGEQPTRKNHKTINRLDVSNKTPDETEKQLKELNSPFDN